MSFQEFELLVNDYTRRKAEERAFAFNTHGMSHPQERSWTADDFLPTDLRRSPARRMMPAAEMLAQAMKDAGSINAMKGRL